MSSNPTSFSEASDDRALSFGWASGLRLAVFYTLFFTIVFVAMFGVIYFGFVAVINDHELRAARNRAAEYEAWFRTGDTEMLQRRMEQQALESGDVMFVRVAGNGSDYVHFIGPGRTAFPVEDVSRLDPEGEAVGIEMGGDRWAVASVDLAKGGVIQAGKNMREGDAMLSRLRTIALVTFACGIIAAALGGAMLTYRSMAPIRRLITTMREVLKKGNMGQRVEEEPGRNELNGLIEIFNRLLDRNEALIEGMHESLDNVAHDLRTPLGRLKNTAENALQEDVDPAQAREALADCVEESEYVATLLTTLMDVAEAESGAMRLRLERLSLCDLVESIVELYELVAEEKAIEVNTDLPDECIVRVDRTRLGQVLANLLDNAIKFSPKGGCVRIAVKEEGAEASLTIQDQGPGIDDEDLPHIWDRLYRAEPSRSSPGMGLGLSVVKAVVTAHGGSASVVSTTGGGATFRIDLPRRLEPDE